MERREAGGGDFYRTLGARTSKRFARAIVASALEGQASFTEAFRMLGIRKTATFHEAARELGVRFMLPYQMLRIEKARFVLDMAA